MAKLHDAGMGLGFATPPEKISFRDTDAVRQVDPPREVPIYYKRRGGSHLFLSPDVLPTLLVGHPDLASAIHLIPRMVTGLVSATYGLAVHCQASASFEDVASAVESERSDRDGLVGPVLTITLSVEMEIAHSA